MLPVIFWSSAGLIVFAYVGLPLVLLLRGVVRARPITTKPITPRVSLIVVAHNEAATIEAKLENALALDYPRDLLEIIVASDGSSDGTDEVVAAYEHTGILLLAFPRCGKISALNGAAARATGDVLVFSDANSMFEPRALRALVAPFADSRVGAVGGNQRYTATDGGRGTGLGERLYWRYDRMLKRLQSRAGNITAATGAIHAIRRELFRRVPAGVSDDFMTSTRAVAAGYRLVLAVDAVAHEALTATDGAEFRRKARIATRGLYGLWCARSLFNPFRYGFYSLQLFCHKLLRWSVCWFLLTLFGASVAIYGSGGVYVWSLYGQLLFYSFALAGGVLRGTVAARRRWFAVLSIPFYFCMANFAVLTAWLDLVRGRRVDLWASPRVGTGPEAATATSRIGMPA